MGVNRKSLTEAAKSEAMKSFEASSDDFLDPKHRPANVVGMGIGVKWKKGRPTGEPAMVVMVSKKVPREQLAAVDLIPSKLGGMQTDLLEVGVMKAEQDDAILQQLTLRARPVSGGYSVGHINTSAGTIATCVYDLQQQGLGIPPRYYILSNNHVLADSNAGNIGDPILQPGPADGGEYPTDQIAVLSRFVPIQFDPPVPLDQQNNLVDAAVAEGPFDSLNRSIYWIGRIRGWRRTDDINLGTLVQKTGRSSSYSLGQIQLIHATVDIGYPGDRVARFRDQIISSRFTEPGDSGSLITTLDNVAIGLHFAGSETISIANPIENVRNLLGIEIAEQVL
ncbi:hypothetical protein EDC14_1005188 [Hydrogenispora ethanolica]|uniref:Serine protease n=1 Tax=Hydrogenispora ethanolica TaxID=1082276 RepID=A0A4R1S2B3_HYDET|nr:S1 family peptidase [Hydrogenispora ethanolica]TCL73325.1 hypothetical protein EDC14_1005188 [Hydrogenispora ethanolica]